MGKVYRKDQPNMKGGRFREFVQCDYDCLDNKGDPNMADAETISLLISIMNKLEISYTIRLNNRNILFSLLEYCDIPSNLYVSVCISIDKLDKKNWSYVSDELKEKGLDLVVINKLRETLILYKNIGWNSLLEVQFITPKQ